MNIIAFLSLFASSIGLIDEAITARRSWKISVLFISFILSLIPVLYGLFEFFTSPKSRIKRLVVLLLKYIFSKDYKSKLDMIEFKFKPLYCNPFDQDSSVCGHYQCLMKDVSGTGTTANFTSHVFVNCRVDFDFLSEIDQVEVGDEKFELRSRNFKDSFSTFECSNTKKVDLLISHQSWLRLHYNIGIRETELILSYDLTNNELSCKILKIKTGYNKSKYYKCDPHIFSELVKIFQFVHDTNRGCCFVLDGYNSVRSGVRLHCMKIFELVEHVIGGGKIVYTKDFGSEFKVSEGRIDDMLMDFKFRPQVLIILKEFIGENYKYYENSIMSQLSVKGWYWSFKDKCNSTPNWKWKRIGVDLSYLLEKMEMCSLKFSDKTINPTLKVQDFYLKNKPKFDKITPEIKSDPILMPYNPICPFTFKGSGLNKYDLQDIKESLDVGVLKKKYLSGKLKRDFKDKSGLAQKTSFYCNKMDKKKNSLKERKEEGKGVVEFFKQRVEFIHLIKIDEADNKKLALKELRRKEEIKKVDYFKETLKMMKVIKSENEIRKEFIKNKVNELKEREMDNESGNEMGKGMLQGNWIKCKGGKSSRSNKFESKLNSRIDLFTFNIYSLLNPPKEVVEELAEEIGLLNSKPSERNIEGIKKLKSEISRKGLTKDGILNNTLKYKQSCTNYLKMSETLFNKRVERNDNYLKKFEESLKLRKEKRMEESRIKKEKEREEEVSLIRMVDKIADKGKNKKEIEPIKVLSKEVDEATGSQSEAGDSSKTERNVGNTIPIGKGKGESVSSNNKGSEGDCQLFESAGIRASSKGGIKYTFKGSTVTLSKLERLLGPENFEKFKNKNSEHFEMIRENEKNMEEIRMENINKKKEEKRENGGEFRKKRMMEDYRPFWS